MATKTRDRKLRRRRRVRGKITGSADRPRLSVARSNRRIYAQLIDDAQGHTLAAAGSHESEIANLRGVDAAAAVGSRLAERAKGAGIGPVVFDRGGFKFHGQVKALADAAREGGLEF
jgi:large subunit ribosomal protein L18